MNAKPPQRLFDKINALPAELREQVEAFVDGLDPAAATPPRVSSFLRAGESSLRRVWDNPEDDIYDSL